MQVGKALASLCIWVDSPELLLLADVDEMSTKVSCFGLYIRTQSLPTISIQDMAHFCFLLTCSQLILQLISFEKLIFSERNCTK